MSEIIWSSVTFTKDEFINARANILNDKIKACCHENGWTFMSNSDVAVHHLRDNVHFNQSGERLFVKNVIELTSRLFLIGMFNVCTICLLLLHVLLIF